MVMPLGPDLTRTLQFDISRMGWVSASYTTAAIVANVLGLKFLDRLPRKQMLLILWLLFSFATWLCSQATDLYTLLGLRALTGLFGAPSLAIGVAIVLDQTAPELRGRVMSTVMSGFTLAAVVGVPAILWIADRFGSSWVFHFLGCIALGLVLCIQAMIPHDSNETHAVTEPAFSSVNALLQQPQTLKMFGIQALNQGAAFLLIPVLAAFQVSNLGVARSDLSLYYLCGGIAAFLMIQAYGRWIDQYGVQRCLNLASLIFILGFYPLWTNAQVGSLVFFVAFMAGNAGRNISLAVSSSHIPTAQQRARYFSLQNIVQDGAIIIGSLLSSQILTSTAGGSIQKMPYVATLAWGCVLLTIWLHRRWFKY